MHCAVIFKGNPFMERVTTFSPSRVIRVYNNQDMTHASLEDINIHSERTDLDNTTPNNIRNLIRTLPWSCMRLYYIKKLKSLLSPPLSHVKPHHLTTVTITSILFYVVTFPHIRAFVCGVRNLVSMIEKGWERRLFTEESKSSNFLFWKSSSIYISSGVHVAPVFHSILLIVCTIKKEQLKNITLKLWFCVIIKLLNLNNNW